MTKNVYLETENKKMFLQHDELKELCSKTSALNVTYKTQLDKEIACKEDTMEGNQIMKKKLNNVTAKCLEQKEKIKTLEYSLQRSAVKRVSQVPIQIVGMHKKKRTEIMINHNIQIPLLHPREILTFYPLNKL